MIVSALLWIPAMGVCSFALYGCFKKKKGKKSSKKKSEPVKTPAPSQEGVQSKFTTESEFQSKRHDYKGAVKNQKKGKSISGQTVLKSTFAMPEANQNTVDVPSLDLTKNTYQPSKTVDPSRLTNTDIKQANKSVTAITGGLRSSTEVTMDKALLQAGYDVSKTCNTTQTQNTTAANDSADQKKNSDKNTANTQTVTTEKKKSGNDEGSTQKSEKSKTGVTVIKEPDRSVKSHTATDSKEERKDAKKTAEKTKNTADDQAKNKKAEPDKSNEVSKYV